MQKQILKITRFFNELKLKIYISVKELLGEATFSYIHFRQLVCHNFFRAGSSTGF